MPDSCQRVSATHGNGVCAEIRRGGRARRTAAELPPGGAGPQPAGSLSLRANFSWTLIGNIVYTGCQWGILVVLAKLGSPETVGQFVLGLAVVSPVMMFANLQLRALLATDARGDFQFRDYVSLRLATTALALIVIAVVSLAYRIELLLVILGIGIAKAVESLSDILFGLLQQRERMDLIGRSMMLKGVCSTGVVAVLFYATRSVACAAAGVAAVWACILAFYDLRCARRLSNARNSPPAVPGPRRATRDLRKLRSLCVLGLPLGLVMLLISLNTNVPRYFLQYHFGEWELGIFAALSYIMTAGWQVSNALGQSASPRLAKHHAEGNRAAFGRLLATHVKVSLVLGAAGVLAAVFAGREILALLYRPDYAEYQGAFVILMLGGALSYLASAFGYAATASRRIRFQPLAILVVLALTAVSCWVWVPRGGLWGSACAVLVGSVASLVCNVGLLYTRSH